MTDYTYPPGWWFRLRQFVNRHASKLALGLVVAATFAGMAGLRWEADQRQDRIDGAAVERRSQICAEARNLRVLVSELIDTAVAGDDDGLPLTTLDSFHALPPEVQTYLRDLAAVAGDRSDSPGLAERLREFQRTRLAELPAFCTGPNGDG